MGLKQRIAGRLDRRYVTRRDFRGAVRRLDGLEAARVATRPAPDRLDALSTELATAREELAALTAAHRADLAARAVLEGDLREARRLTNEAVFALQAVLETEVRHRQMIDSLSGDGA